MSGLSEQERDSLTECECGHFANEHSSTGCLATDFSEDWRPVRDDDVCSCTHSPTAINRHAIEAIVAARVAAARKEAAAKIEASEDLIFAALMAHQRIPTYSIPGANRCVGCDDLFGESDGSNSPRHTRHLAQHVATSLATDIRKGADRG